MRFFLLSFVAAFVFAVSPVNNEPLNWAPRAKFRNFNEYFPNLMQQLIYEVENYGWCNLKLADQTVNINQEIYDRHFNGYVNYSNGFLVSIEKIVLAKVVQSFFQGIISFTTTGTMTALLEFKNVVIGYDVQAHFGEDIGVHRFTGTFNHTEVDFVVRIDKNLNTSVITPSFRLGFLSGGSGVFMQYLPDTDIGEVLGRHYLPSSVFRAIDSWGIQVFRTITTRLINELGFPDVCFN